LGGNKREKRKLLMEEVRAMGFPGTTEKSNYFEGWGEVIKKKSRHG